MNTCREKSSGASRGNKVDMTASLLFDKYGMMLTVPDLTELLKVSRPVVDSMILSGDLPAAKVGKQYRIEVCAFVNWWNNRVKQEQKNALKGCLTPRF